MLGTQREFQGEPILVAFDKEILGMHRIYYPAGYWETTRYPAGQFILSGRIAGYFYFDCIIYFMSWFDCTMFDTIYILYQ